MSVSDDEGGLDLSLSRHKSKSSTNLKINPTPMTFDDAQHLSMD